MSQEGLLWFQNLTEADPYGILPLGFLIPSLIGITVSDTSIIILALFSSSSMASNDPAHRFNDSSPPVRFNVASRG